jgi:cardiolipin synthase
MQILNTASRYVYIATPYLILDNNMTAALVMAAKSGVDVRIVTPFIPDKRYVHPASQFHYSELLDAGIRIFEYKPGFMHSKIFICDDLLATSGSVNMDYRSFVFHFECGVWFTNADTISEMKAHFKNICNQSEEIFISQWNKRGLFKKFKEWFLHLFSPLM